MAGPFAEAEESHRLSASQLQRLDRSLGPTFGRFAKCIHAWGDTPHSRRRRSNGLSTQPAAGILRASMRAVIQRVSRASVTIDHAVRAAIGPGLLILLGVAEDDSAEDIEWLSGKIARLRIFPDEAGQMNRSVVEMNGALLVVSQFTLLASTRKGNRPSYIRAARPEDASPLCDRFADRLAVDAARPVARGQFGADMKVELINDGPVTIVMDSRVRE